VTEQPESPDGAITNPIEAHLASIASSMLTLVEENRDLRERLDDAIIRIDSQNDLIRRRTRAYKVTVAAFVAVLIVFGVVILDNQRAIRENNRKMCPVVGVSAMGPRSTPIGEWLRDRFHELFVDFDCTPEDLKDIPRFNPGPTPTQTAVPSR
jgi:hypothetical protein